MSDLSDDPIANVVHGQIKRDIRILLDAGCLTGALKLVYSGIDTMAYLAMPEGKLNVDRADFISWCDRYIRFPGRTQLRGVDLYGARCAVLHQHGTESDMSRRGLCRQVGYVDDMQPPVVDRPEIDAGLVMVSIRAFASAFLDAIDVFLIDLFADAKRAPVAEERLQGIIHVLPNDKPEGAV